MSNTYLTKTYAQNAGNRKKFTVSAWFKRSKLGATQDLISAYRASDGLQTDVIRFGATDDLEFYAHSTLGNGPFNYQTNRLFRDTSAWYHVVVLVSTIDNTASDRVRIYVNGVRETSFSVANNPSQNDETVWGIGSGVVHTIGAVGTANYFDGSASHIHYCDGYAYNANNFGETDTTTGEWKAKTSPSVTYGTNGFFILKDGNGITDQSGEGNDFTLSGGTLTDLKDNPDNVFATLNPLNANIGATIPTLSMGNNRTSNSIINKMQTQYSTLAPETGKFYCEVKATAGSVFRIGISSYNSNQAQGSSDTQNRPGQFSEGWGYDKTGTVYKSESSVGSYTAYNTGDIICIALDMTNKKLYFKRDANAWENSANPATGSNGIDISSISSGTGMAFGAGLESGSVGAAYADFNFGNGYFGTTAVSSAGTNASEIGIFEYDVPTGYTALSTKGLNE